MGWFSNPTLSDRRPRRQPPTAKRFRSIAGDVITIFGGAAGNTVNAAALSAAHRIVFVGGAGADNVTGGAGDDTFSFAAAALTAADTVIGGAGRDQLILTTAGIAGANRVSGVETFVLSSAGVNAIVLGNANFTGITGTAITVIGGSAGNVVIAQAVSAPHEVVYVGGAGPDLFLDGGANSVFEFAAANLTNADLIEGAIGADQLLLTTGGAAQLGGVSGVETIRLAAASADTITLDDSNFAGITGSAITVIDGGHGDSVDAAEVSAAKRAVFVGGAGVDLLTGGAGDDTFSFTTTTLSGPDRLVGGAGADHLVLGSAGAIAAGGVKGIETFTLSSAGRNTLALSGANFAGVIGNTITVNGGNAGNTLSAALPAGDKAVLHGGTGNDTFMLSPTTMAGATVTGGAGADLLAMTAAGALATGGASGVETWRLANGAANTLTLGDVNFDGVTGNAITIFDGNAGNTVNGKVLAAADRIVVHAGPSADALTGGAGNDVFFAGGETGMTGGAGANQFVFSSIGTNTIADFAASASDTMLFLSGSGFSLPGAGAASKPLGALFTANPTGAFTAAGQRFGYDTANGKLFYSANGTTASEQLVVTIAGHPTLNLAHLLFAT